MTCSHVSVVVQSVDDLKFLSKNKVNQKHEVKCHTHRSIIYDASCCRVGYLSAPISLSVISREHFQGISLNLAQTFSWTRGRTDSILAVKTLFLGNISIIQLQIMTTIHT